MSFKFRCPSCNTKLEAEDDWVGMETACPSCHQSITITAELAKEEPIKEEPAKEESKIKLMPIPSEHSQAAPVSPPQATSTLYKYNGGVQSQQKIGMPYNKWYINKYNGEVQSQRAPVPPPIAEPRVEESSTSSVGAEGTASDNTPLKSRKVYLLLGILLSCSGAHDFYAGYTTKGIIKLSITLCSCCTLAIISTIWAVVDVCTITQDAEGRPFAE